MNISIVIAFKDEAEVIDSCLKALNSQLGIIKSHVQIVLVNDHSLDNSVELIQIWQKSTSFQNKLIHVRSGHGKKNALRIGVENAKYETLIFTDADCIPSVFWLNEMLNCYCTSKPDLLIGTVWYKESDLIFERIQQLEFAVLQSITMISAQVQWPFMCNGANLLTKKSIYEAFIKTESNTDIVSGDDVFYMDYLIKQAYHIECINSAKAIVETQGENTIKSFINQRIRWSSKVKFYKNIHMILPSVMFSIWSLGLVFFLFIAFLVSHEIGLFLILFKLIVDYYIVHWFYKSFYKSFKIIDFFILTLIYPFYIFYIGLLSFFKTFTWKNRLAKA